MPLDAALMLKPTAIQSFEAPVTPDGDVDALPVSRNSEMRTCDVPVPEVVVASSDTGELSGVHDELVLRNPMNASASSPASDVIVRLGVVLLPLVFCAASR